MLVEEQGWLMPLLFLCCGLWAMSPLLKIHDQERRWGRHLVHALPLGVLMVMLIDRARALLTHSAGHPEVATFLSSNDGTSARLQVLFTGQGAIEGAIFSFLLFSVLSSRLPSLRTASNETKQAVQRRMVAHAGVWSMALLTLLFPESQYQSPAVIPVEPTQSIAPWSMGALVFIMTLVLIMASEIVAATGTMSTTREAKVLLQRAILKMAVALPIAWWAWASSGLELNDWWQRPDDQLLWGVGMMVLTYGTMISAVHAPALSMEGRWHSQQHPTSTLLLSVVASMVVMTILSWAVAIEAGFRTSEDGGWASLRLTGAWLLVTGACMTLPTVGLDAAHRPELWWYRMVLCASVPVGLMVTENMILLGQGVLMGGSMSLLWPWALEQSHHPKARFRSMGAAFVLMVAGVGLALSSMPWPWVMTAQALLSLATAGGLSWAVRSIPNAM